MPVVGNPWNAGAVFQALPTVQGMGSMDSAHLYHGLTVGAEQLRLASLRAVNRGIGVGVVSDMSRGAVCGGNHVSDAEALAVGVGGTLMDSVKEHCKAPF